MQRGREPALPVRTRHEVAARASRLTGQNVSKAMLDGYTAPSRGTFNIPLWVAPVLEVICGGTLLAEWQAQVIGGQLLLGAETLDVVLLIDEGDALMGNRTEVRGANDRYANLETNFLLQRLEAYQGIIMITTNARDVRNLDF